MSDVVIQVKNLSKQYQIGSATEQYRTFREALTNTFTYPFRRLRNAFNEEVTPTHHKPEYIWALKDVSFEVKRGELIGIIGRNGAGKSTLLKILARITEPTEGRVTLRGRVGSLLEIGTGFHSELTGEENIYLSGTILGMSSNEISQKFNEIVAFAEVEKFIHTPVKYYSSGMYMRLAFAVAAHLETEILLVDEVLAVGDASFQKKCLGKMGDAVNEGRTVLFVSHNMGAIKSVCTKGILLNEGHLIYMDSIENVINKYLTDTLLHSKQFVSGTNELKLTEFKIYKNNQSVNTFNTFDNITFYITYDAFTELNDVTIAICFNNLNNTRITSLWTKYINQSFNLKKGRNTFNFKVRRIKLIPGMYEIILYAEKKGLTLERIDKFKQIVVGAPEVYDNDQIMNSNQGLYLEEFTVENV